MDRRHFTNGLLTTALAAPPILGPTSALGNPLREEEENARIAEWAPVTVRVAAQHVIVKWIVLYSSLCWFGMNIAKHQRQFNERRASIGGMFGRFTRPTVSQRLKAAHFVGQLFFLQNSLILLPNRKIDYRRLEYTLFHEYLSWDLEAAIRIVNLGNRTPEQIRAKARLMGVAYLSGALMMLMVNPVLRRNYTGS